MRLLGVLHKDLEYHDGSFKKWAHEASPATPFHYSDGVRYFMSTEELAPWDEWTTDPNASPIKPDGWAPEQ